MALGLKGTATLSPGSLGVAAPSTLQWSATLSGFDLDKDGQLTYTLVDATGSGTGWNLTASATPLTDSTGTTKCTSTSPCRMHKPILFNASTTTPLGTTAPKPVCATGSTCTLPRYSKVAYPVTLTLTASTGDVTPVTLASSGRTSGMGAVTCATDWWLNIPANAYAGTYTNTITLTISSGP